MGGDAWGGGGVCWSNLPPLSPSTNNKQLAFVGTLLEVVNKIQQSCYLGRHATLCRDELNRNLHKVVYTKLGKYSAEIFFSKGHLFLIFVALQIKIIHIYLSMSRTINRVFYKAVENSSRWHPPYPLEISTL